MWPGESTERVCAESIGVYIMGRVNLGTVCTHPLVGICTVRSFDINGRAIVEYGSKRYSKNKVTASIAPWLLKVVNG